MKKLTAISLVIGLVFSGSALADHDDRYSRDSRYGNSNNYSNSQYHNGYMRYDKAKVIRVEPVYRYSRDRYSRDRNYRPAAYEQCYRDNRSYASSHERRKGSIIGGVIGAVIGHKIGDRVGHHRSSDKIGAVTGAIIGSKIGREATENKRHRGYDEYCETRYQRDSRYDEHRYGRDKIIGYNVTYKYKGKRYTSFMDYDPGRWVEVAVDVRPSRR
ncbi:MAG: glycine zipper 2TM domain-containing protein [Kangiellaceae bacterium]|nr:glycine zipper 2TM domain-containing protein [Kangiellaceae bacterium]